MADAGGLSFLQRLITPPNRPLAHLRRQSVRQLKLSVSCSTSGPAESNQSKSAPRSSRGRTRKSLGLEEAKPSGLQPAPLEAISEPSILKEREGTAQPPAPTSRENNAANLLQEIKSKSAARKQGKATSGGPKYSEAQSLMDWTNRNNPPAESSESTEQHNPEMPKSKELSQRIQDMINADLERKFKSRDDDSDEKVPLFVEEDDPYWLDEPDEGWGFKISDLYKENFGVKEGSKKRVKDDDDDASDIPDIDWDYQPERWSAKDLDSMNWSETVFGDPSPLVVLLYDRYGKKGRECYHVLRELEEAANRMWDCKRLPPRLGKVNASFEEDLIAAIGVKEVPTILFIRGGKMKHYQSGYFTADDLIRMMSYFYHGAARPPCLTKVDPASMKP